MIEPSPFLMETLCSFALIHCQGPSSRFKENRGEIVRSSTMPNSAPDLHEADLPHVTMRGGRRHSPLKTKLARPLNPRIMAGTSITWGQGRDEVESDDNLYRRGDGPGHRPRRHRPRPVPCTGDAETVRGVYLDRQHDLPAPDQDDHRTARILHPGGGNRPHVRRRRGRGGSAARPCCGSSAPRWCPSRSA